MCMVWISLFFPRYDARVLWAFLFIRHCDMQHTSSHSTSPLPCAPCVATTYETPHVMTYVTGDHPAADVQRDGTLCIDRPEMLQD